MGINWVAANIVKSRLNWSTHIFMGTGVSQKLEAFIHRKSWQMVSRVHEMQGWGENSYINVTVDFYGLLRRLLTVQIWCLHTTIWFSKTDWPATNRRTDQPWILLSIDLRIGCKLFDLIWLKIEVDNHMVHLKLKILPRRTQQKTHFWYAY